MEQVKVDMGVDRLQERLTSYASALTFEDMAAEDVHDTKVRLIDTIGAFFGGFFGEPCRLGRNLAAMFPAPNGTTVLGTRQKTTPDMAAFVNSTTSRYVEMNDVYHWPGSSGGHPSDVLLPVFGVAEHVKAGGKDLLTAIALAYEVYLRIADATKTPGFDSANFLCIGSAMASAKVMGLSSEQMHHCISMAVVPNNALNQGRTGHLSMWKAVAAGQGGRAGVFAAMLAAQGFEGPHMPFEGKAGWCKYVSPKQFMLDEMGGKGIPFKIRDTLIKQRASCATTISSILAGEAAAAQIRDKADIEHVTVETYSRAKIGMGTGEHHWNPTNRETADHSIPYVTAAALMDGTVGPRQFHDDHIWNPELRALIQKIEVVAVDEFTETYERHPVIHQTRVRVRTRNGEEIVGESGGEKGDLSNPKSDRDIEEKFRSLTEQYFGARRVRSVLDYLWRSISASDVSGLPAMLVID